MLQAVNHGGHCCGVKHILGFPYRPNDMTTGLSAVSVSIGASPEMAPGKRFYPGPEPQEPGGVRLDKLLDYIDKYKTAHLVEAVLNKSIAANWKEFLEERGFKQVTEFKNSNTDSKLYVFHRVTPLPPELKALQAARQKKAAAEAAKEAPKKEPVPVKAPAVPLRRRPPATQRYGLITGCSCDGCRRARGEIQ